jgi:hypothetical protein
MSAVQYEIADYEEAIEMFLPSSAAVNALAPLRWMLAADALTRAVCTPCSGDRRLIPGSRASHSANRGKLV